MISKKNLYKKGIIVLLLIVFTFISFTLVHLRHHLSTHIRIQEGESHYVNIGLPFIFVRAECQADDEEVLFINGETPSPFRKPSPFSQPLNLEAVNRGKVNLQFSLLGVVPLKSVTVNVLPEIKVIPGGQSIGINLHSEGVMVVEYYQIEHKGEQYSPAREAGVKKGDYIIAVEGEIVRDVHHAAKLLERAAAKGKVELLIKRDQREMVVTVKPVYSREEEGHRIGIYIRDTEAGVGTLTFYHPESRRYGALGHIIMDAETQKPVNIQDGQIVNASIVNIRAAERGSPGEKTGLFKEGEDVLGSIDKNTPFGIFGNIENPDKLKQPYTRPMPVGLAGRVEKGPAKILTVLENQAVEGYEIEIMRASPQSTPGDKGMVINITDDRLMEKTGGIIQGMSGSPIIQNGRIIGAVTHVFVNNPRRGYGVFMEWMIEEADIY